MKIFYRNILNLILLSAVFLTSGCSGIPEIPFTPAPGTETPRITPIKGLSTQISTTATAKPIPTDTPQEKTSLRVWVPPEFDPNAETPAGLLFKRRLDAFAQHYPGLTIEVRIKALDGPGGLLDSLTTASAAAPLALPDLIALPRRQLEVAALKGLLSPYDGLTDLMDSSDWYSYARELAMIQNSIYGLPFAGDALGMVFRPSIIETPPKNWDSVIENGNVLIFPAADSHALFTVTLYRASDGAVYDEQDRPYLDADVLVKVLDYYAQAEQAGVMPSWLTQYQSEDQSWEAFLENRSDLVVSWTSHYLRNSIEGTSLAPIPTQNGKAFTLAEGWVWALAAAPTEYSDLRVELAEFLVDSEFLVNWMVALGYLPTRPSVLEVWPAEALQSEISPILLSASLFPSNEILNSMGLPLQQAVIQVLKDQVDPVVATQIAVASVVAP